MKRTRHYVEETGQYYALMGGNAIRRRWHLNKLRLFSLTELSAEDRVLDAGCGSGNLIFELAPRCRQAIGCDLRHSWLSFGARMGRGSFIQADLRKLPFANGMFTVVFCMEVLEHLDRETARQALDEFSRVLRPNGRLLLTTPNYHSLWAVIEFFADTLRLVPEMVGGEHISKYHRGTLAGVLSTVGFVIEKMGTFNHFSPFVALLSERWAERLYRWELQESRAGGNLLYAVCRKP